MMTGNNNKRPQRPQRRTIAHSFADALTGIWDCIKMERNMRIHITACFYVIYAACFLELSRSEFAALFLAIGAVLAVEMLNTSVEKLCDFNQKNYSQQIKIIKDISAGGVFVSAVFAVCVGVSVLWRPRLWDFLVESVQLPHRILIFVITLVAAWFFIFWGPVKIADKLRSGENRKKGR